GVIVTSARCSRIRNASRKGARLTFRCSASLVSLRRSPGSRRASMISIASQSAIWWGKVRCKRSATESVKSNPDLDQILIRNLDAFLSNVDINRVVRSLLFDRLALAESGADFGLSLVRSDEPASCGFQRG